MKDKYIVVNNLKSGTKLSESSPLYVTDIAVVMFMALLGFVLEELVIDNLTIPFVIFNMAVGVYMTTSSRSNPGFRRWKSIYMLLLKDTSYFYSLKNISQQAKTEKLLREIKNEKEQY